MFAGRGPGSAVRSWMSQQHVWLRRMLCGDGRLLSRVLSSRRTSRKHGALEFDADGVHGLGALGAFRGIRGFRGVRGIRGTVL